MNQAKTSVPAVCPYMRLSPCSTFLSISALLKLWSLKLNSCTWAQTEMYFNWVCGQLVVDREVFKGDEWLPLAEIYYYSGERKIVVTLATVLLIVSHPVIYKKLDRKITWISQVSQNSDSFIFTCDFCMIHLFPWQIFTNYFLFTQFFSQSICLNVIIYTRFIYFYVLSPTWSICF